MPDLVLAELVMPDGASIFAPPIVRWMDGQETQIEDEAWRRMIGQVQIPADTFARMIGFEQEAPPE